MARIPVYDRSQVDVGLSAGLPYISPDPNVARSIARAGESIAQGIRDWAGFVQKADKLHSINVANRNITDFKTGQPIFEQALRDQHRDDPRGYYEAWNQGMKDRIGKVVSGLSGQARDRVNVELNNYHAAKTTSNFEWGTTTWWDKIRGDAEEDLRKQVLDAATKGDSWEAHEGFAQAIQKIDELVDLGAYSHKEGVVARNQALSKFEQTRATDLIYNPGIPSGPEQFLIRAAEGRYEHMDPLMLEKYEKMAHVEIRRRINEAITLSNARDKAEEKRLTEQRSKANVDLLNSIIDLERMDPLKEGVDINHSAGELNKKIDRLGKSRVLTTAQVATFKNRIQIEVDKEAHNNEVYQDYWIKIYRGLGVDKDQLISDMGDGHLNNEAVKELLTNAKPFHFTADPEWRQAVTLINNQFGVEGLSILRTVEKAQRELLRQNALRTLWENAKKTEGSINHVELANRLVDRQAERIGSLKRLEAPIGPGKGEKEQKTKDKKKRAEDIKKRR